MTKKKPSIFQKIFLWKKVYEKNCRYANAGAHDQAKK